jgi:hypothetical protein
VKAEPLPIVGFYNQARFKQFDPADIANWTVASSETGKKKVANYPAMGREHINYLEKNQLIFPSEPRAIFKSVNYWYAVVRNQIFRIDSFFNIVEITQRKMTTVAGDVYFAYLIVGEITFSCFTDGQNIYVYVEGGSDNFQVVTDANAPSQPTYIAAFGGRIVVAQRNSSQFSLSEVGLQGSGFNPATCFTIASSAVFAQAQGIIRQFGVLDNTLYIFSDFTTAPWSNTISYIAAEGGVTNSFPWSTNQTYNWDFGIADSNTLSVGFDRMAWLAQNREGLKQPMVSGGEKPSEISNEAVDVLIQRIINANQNMPTTNGLNATGFMYEYENSIFYRLNIGEYLTTQPFTQFVDYKTSATSIEYKFKTKTWSRCIELNGSRNRIQRHVYFGNRHLVSVQNDSTVYEMAGNFYTNDITNPEATDPQHDDAYLREPFRYERVTPLIFEDDYMEFLTEYVEIDMVWGETPYVRTNGAYANTQFIIDESSTPNEPVFLVTESSDLSDPSDSQFIIGEAGNFPQINEQTYYNYYKPIVELYYSDDGGISFQTVDAREFTQLGQYRWTMRWYELGTSRNRCYRLVCVSPVTMVLLGAVQMKRRVANDNS